MLGFTILLISLGALCKGIDPTVQECGTTNPNGHTIDDSDSPNPKLHQDLTGEELVLLRQFLERDPNIKAAKSSNATLNSSYIFTADLHMPKKEEVLNYLDKGGPQPPRLAHIVMFRGDKTPPLVEEYVCGPMPNIAKCELFKTSTRRNPTEFTARPQNGLEMKVFKEVWLKILDKLLGKVLTESYGAKFTGCSKQEDCLTLTWSAVETGIVGDINKRYMWMTAAYDIPYRSVNILDMSLLYDLSDTDPLNWTIKKVWYCGQLFTSVDDFLNQYNNNTIEKTKVTKPVNDDNLFSSLKRRGDPQPPKPQRPPRLVEPDGKRYTVKDKKVEYMEWRFGYHLSSLTGPAIYDVQFKGERMAYEISLKEVANLYSANAPFGQTLNQIGSGRMLGSRSRAVVPGAGCPETGTSLQAKFMNQYGEDPAVYNSSWCIFENNDGNPLRRHLSYQKEEGGFYAGMLNSYLTLRTVMTFVTHDTVFDFNFFQNGVCQVKVMTTGYLVATFYTNKESPFGPRIHDRIDGNHHLSFYHIKADLGSTKNRFETLQIDVEKSKLSAFLDKPYQQLKISSKLKRTEKESIDDSKNRFPGYHIIHSGQDRNKFNESRAYRIDIQGVTKSEVAERLAKDRGLDWAGQQLVVTKRKDDEESSSSMFALFDTKSQNFSSYFEDDENIIDEDLIAWIRLVNHCVPRSEDIPNVGAVTKHVSVFFAPHNYHPECPSISSRDAIYIDYKDKNDPSKGVKVDRNGNTRDQCVLPKSTLEETFEEDPNRILEVTKENPTDF